MYHIRHLNFYSWTGPADSIAPADKNKLKITTNKVGEYTVNISNGFQQCSQKISISGTACTAIPTPNFCLGVPLAPPSGAGGAVLPNLAVGDIITAGAFEYTITQVDSPTQPFKGKATMNIINGPANLKAGLKTEFSGISINECYQVTSVTAQPVCYFRSEYDPSWGNVFDLSTKTPKPAELGEELAALIAANSKILDEMETFDQATATCGQKDRLLQQIAEIQAIIAQINASDLYTTQQKTDIITPENTLITTLNNAIACITCTPGGRVLGEDCVIFEKESFKTSMFGLINLFTKTTPGNLRCKPTNRAFSSLRQTTGDWTDVFINGVWAHNLIEEHYHQLFKSTSTVYLEYYIPQSSSKITGEAGFADIVNETTGEIFEIKSEKGILNGRDEVTVYVDKANSFCYQIAPRAWKKGEIYTGAWEIIWPLDFSKKMKVRKAESGVILYDIVSNSNPKLTPIAAPSEVYESIKEKIKRLANLISHNPTPSFAYNESLKFLNQLSKAAVIGIMIGGVIGDVAAIFEEIGTGGLGTVPIAIQAVMCTALVVAGTTILTTY
jgi:hypothetical protein